MRALKIAAPAWIAARSLLFGMSLILATSIASAQQKNVSGVITNANDGSPVSNATVQVKGTNRGTTTNEKGEYNILAGANETIMVTVIGFAPIEKSVGSSSTLNFTLSSDAIEMQGVVVTALGISRQQKALGYSAQQINTDELNDARSNNWSSALSGKVAGLQLLSAGSGPVNSTRITLRGDISLNLNNAYGAGSGNDAPIDFGNGIADINPDDIASITVLKGPGATALYGSRAGNGALIITTKSGRKTRGIGITVNSNVSFDNVLKWPDYQYEYGQGTGRALNSAGELYYSYGATADGASTSGTSSAFGPRFNGQMYFQYDPVLQGRGADRTLWRPYKDNIKGFFQTGSTITNSVSMEGGNENGSARLSITHSKNEWIMPNTGFERITAQTSLNYQTSEKLKINTKVSYTNKSSDNVPTTGYNNQSIAYFMIFQNPNVDLNWYRDIWKKGMEQIDQIHPFSSFIDNPFLMAYEMTNSYQNNNVIGSASATYEFSDKFNLMLRSGLNLMNEDRQQRRPFSTANFQRGYYKEQAITNYEMNSDFLFTYKDKFTNDISFSASAGGNAMNHKYNRIDGSIEGLVIPAVYKLTNGLANPMMNVVDRNYKVNSLYGLAAVSYQDKIFLDLTARNDWSSTLPEQSWSFFYPSANASFILSDIFKLPTTVSFAKLRLSAAQSGNDADPYQTSKYYGNSDFPSSGSVDRVLFNANLKPEISTSYESGLEMRFLQNRLGFDLTYYNSTTKNQIVRVPLDPTTGYTSAILNSGKVRNKGVEVILNAKPINNQDFKWSVNVNWAKNENEVLELAEQLGSTGKQDIGYGGNATIQARVGGTTGDIYGFGFVRAPDGQIVYTAAGLPARPSEIQYIGNAFADWKGGIQNEFSYKNFSFSFLLDGQYGGMIYSQTHHKMTEQGKLKHTLRGREENFIIGEGVVLDGSGRYVPNTTKVLPVSYYADYYRRANVESNSFDASYLKLREARLEYVLPKSILDRTFIQQVTVAVYGRNLLMWTDFPIFDPETAAFNGNTILPGVEMGQMPSTRTMGANVTLRF